MCCCCPFGFRNTIFLADLHDAFNARSPTFEISREVKNLCYGLVARIGSMWFLNFSTLVVRLLAHTKPSADMRHIYGCRFVYTQSTHGLVPAFFLIGISNISLATSIIVFNASVVIFSYFSSFDRRRFSSLSLLISSASHWTCADAGNVLFFAMFSSFSLFSDAKVARQFKNGLLFPQFFRNFTHSEIFYIIELNYFRHQLISPTSATTFLLKLHFFHFFGVNFFQTKTMTKPPLWRMVSLTFLGFLIFNVVFSGSRSLRSL